MLVDLVQTTTRDGMRLDGAFQAAAASAPPAVAVDSFCLVHGTGGNFYGSTLFDGFAERLLGLGCGVLRVNTRGHDGVSTAATPQGGRRQGAAYEAGDDCRHDIRAWLEWLGRRAGPRVGLVGHSFGAVKCLYALAREPGLSAACVVALSPPRLSYSAFTAGPQAREFREAYALAERDVEGGRPGALLEVRFPLPMLITAGGYVEKYGPDERYNYLRFLADVPCPVLVTWGGKELEGHTAFRGAPEEVAGVVGKGGPVRGEAIAGADHFYSGMREEAVARVEAWLRSALR